MNKEKVKLNDEKLKKAQENLKKINERIKPFTKKRVIIHEDTIGDWKETKTLV